jgi:hypothetical protein
MADFPNILDISYLSARVNAAAQTIPNVAATPVQMAGTVFDVGGFFNIANPTRLTCPMDGLVAVWGTLEFAANVTGDRLMQFQRNGVNIIDADRLQAITVAGVQTSTNGTGYFQVAKGDYIELLGYQSSGAALGILANSTFGIAYVK